jgi:hypothetical protein
MSFSTDRRTLSNFSTITIHFELHVVTGTCTNIDWHGQAHVWCADILAELTLRTRRSVTFQALSRMTCVVRQWIGLSIHGQLHFLISRQRIILYSPLQLPGRRHLGRELRSRQSALGNEINSVQLLDGAFRRALV